MNNLELKDMEWTEDLFEPLDSSEQNSEFIAMESKTFLQDSWNRFKKNKLALVGLVFLVLMILMAIFVPMFSKYSYDQMDMTALNQLPSAQHWFGTDKFGRDIFVRVMYGARISLAVGFSAAIICLFIGVVYGGISGYVGGKVDMVMMRIVDIIYAIPSLLYVIFIMLLRWANRRCRCWKISACSCAQEKVSPCLAPQDAVNRRCCACWRGWSHSKAGILRLMMRRWTGRGRNGSWFSRTRRFIRG